MSAEELKRKLIPLMKEGHKDDVRCLILIHLRENPLDEEVWEWCVATARNDEDRKRALEQWLRFNPHSQAARRIARKLGGRIGVEVLQETENYSGGIPFNAEEYIKSTFIGQDAMVAELSDLAEKMRLGRNFNLLLQAPTGWGKTLLATLILHYADPYQMDSQFLDAESVQIDRDTHGKRFFVIEDLDRAEDLHQLIPVMDHGSHTFIFTSRENGQIAPQFQGRLRRFVFSDYSLVDLSQILNDRLFRKGMRIGTNLRLQIARYCQGNPKEAISYAERLALLWRNGETAQNLGELIQIFNDHLSLKPSDPDHNYLAIWDDHILRSIGVDPLLAALRSHGFPFGLQFRAPRSSLQFIPPDERKAQVNSEMVTLPPHLFQRQINPAGPLARTLPNAGREAIILGAHSEAELEGLIESCGFELVAAEEASNNQVYPLASIPDAVRAEVWDRDGGKCVICGTRENLAYDYVLPLSKGGSKTARNIHILCEDCFQADRQPSG